MSYPDYRCRECGGSLIKNYDHVGDCDGVCHGTFTHVRDQMRASCSMHNRTVPHEKARKAGTV